VLDGDLSDRSNTTCQIDDYLSESIQCYSGVPQRSHLEPIFFILEINGALDLWKM
jgi:hypothetical protein